MNFIKRKTIRLAAAFLAAMCLLLSGCTGADAPEKPTEKETLTIGSDIYSPYFYLDDNGDFAGIDVEIAEEACRRLGVTPEFKQISWQNKDACLQSGTVQRAFFDNDCVVGSYSQLRFDPVTVHVFGGQKCKNKKFNKTAFYIFPQYHLPMPCHHSFYDIVYHIIL